MNLNSKISRNAGDNALATMVRQIGAFHGQVEKEDRCCRADMQAAFAVFREDKEPAKLCEEFDLHAKIGQLTLESDFLVCALTKTGLLGARC